MAEQPENTSGETPQTQDGPTGYMESTDHVPDPTAMNGTLETSGTGGGVNERVTGTTRIFGEAEQTIGKIEAVVAEHLHDIVDEVRGMLKHEEANAAATNVQQQTVENNGVPEHGGNIVGPGNDTGAAPDANRSPNVAGDAGGVDAGTEQVADGGQGDSYSQQTIAGASNPQDEAAKAQEGQERREGETSQAQAEQDKPKSTPAKRAASKTAASKKTDADK